MSSHPTAAGDGGATLELLVHGVGGTTPQEMLADSRTVRITGDETAAVYRRAEDVDAESHPERGNRPVPEAYCWSNLTSGNGSRALWLLLLPFMVVNLAHWMRPATNGSARTRRFYGLLVRLVALTLTVLLTAAACEVALDLAAWQCAGAARCTAAHSWLGFLAPEQHGWWSQPGRRLALGALVPTALVVLLWYLSNRTWGAYESQRPPTDKTTHGAADGATCDPLGSTDEPDEASGGGAPGVRPALGTPGFWYGRRLVARLRAAHTAAGFLTVATMITVAAGQHDRAVGSPLADVLGLLLQAALGCCAFAVLWVVCRRGRSEVRRDLVLDRAVIGWLPGSSIALLAVAVVYAAWSRPGWVSAGPLPGDLVFRVIAVAQVALVVALAGAAAALHRAAAHPRTVLRGQAGPAVATLACALGAVMTGGLAQRVADWLDGDATPGMGGGRIVGPPVLLSWQAAVIPVLLVLLLVPVAVLAVRTARATRRLGPVVEAEFHPRTVDTVRTRKIAGVRARATLTDAAPWLVGVISGAGLLLGAGAVAGSWLSGEVPGQAAEGTDSLVESVTDTAQALGSWLVGLGFILFVTWGRRAYRHASARRTVGILWDVGTFWPRAAHPFAPPCYAERAVPDLTWRVETWTASTGGRLVLSGHSQGTVLAAATVWQLRASTRRQVALLTYGSPLERLYGRWFPAYFGPDQLNDLCGQVRCWRNLWRNTDPIGGPVRVTAGEAGPEVDRGPLKDPQAYGRSVRRPLPEPVLGHAGYQADPAFAEERAALVDRLSPALPGQRGEPAEPTGSTERTERTEPTGQRSQDSSGSSGRSSE